MARFDPAIHSFSLNSSLQGMHIKASWSCPPPQTSGSPFLTDRERGIYFKSHISWWEHSSHFRLIGRGVPSVSVVSQLVYKFLCLASPRDSLVLLVPTYHEFQVVF